MSLRITPRVRIPLLTMTAGLLVACWQPHAAQGPAPRDPPAGHADAPSDLPVFPGAEGFGTRTRAGRGGRVIAVTSLADRGPGTLRAAVDYPGPRTVVFKVGGTIRLKKFLMVNHPYLTIAGQTAPGDGILIRDVGLVIRSHDVLIQHIRVRPGAEGRVKPDRNDAIQILGPHEGGGAHHVVLDHVSASWGEDETISTWYGPHDITISWSIISEGLNKSRHPKGGHSAGLIVGDGSTRVSVHHNLFAHQFMRSPLYTNGGLHDLVNNVVYNWGWLATDINDYKSNTRLNVVGNYYRRGANSTGNYAVTINPDYGGGVPRLYVRGNYGPRRTDPGSDEWSLVSDGYEKARPAPARYRAPTPFDTPPVTTQDAAEALDLVLAGAGATKPVRDPVDARVVASVRDRSGAIIDSPEQVGGFPDMAGGAAAPRDSDGDGMPDEWENGAGLNPSDPTDGNRDQDGDGYTNLEEYLHSLL